MKPEILIVAASICAICLSQLKFVQSDENQNEIHPVNIMSGPLDAEEKHICGKNIYWWCQLLGFNMTSTSKPSSSSTHRVINPREKRDDQLEQNSCKPICRCDTTCKAKYCTCTTFCTKDAVQAPHTHPCICNDKYDTGKISDKMLSDESSNNSTKTTTPPRPSCSCRASCTTYSYTENNFCYIRVHTGSKNPNPKCQCYYNSSEDAKFTCDCYGGSA